MLKVPKVFKVSKDPMVLKVMTASKVMMVIKVYRVFKVDLVPVQMVSKVHKGCKVSKVS